jgi:imidazolonepropionase-like amidohydrolase
VIFDVQTEGQIRGALALADTFKLRIVLRGATEAWMLADTLAARKVPVVVGPLTSVPDGDAPYDAIYANPGVLAKAGVTIAFQTDDSGEGDARNLPYNAALATAYGLDPEEALRAITLNPARIWGVADKLGSIEPGKVANLFLTTGDPLDVRSQVRHVFIRGQLMPWDDRHTQEYQKFRARPKP